MKPRHSQQLALLPVVLCAAVALCLMPLVTHAQEQKPLVFTFRGPVRGSVPSTGVREFLGIPHAPSPVQETDFATSHHCVFWAALLSAQ
jgi:hypothetical protein